MEGQNATWPSKSVIFMSAYFIHHRPHPALLFRIRPWALILIDREKTLCASSMSRLSKAVSYPTYYVGNTYHFNLMSTRTRIWRYSHSTIFSMTLHVRRQQSMRIGWLYSCFNSDTVSVLKVLYECDLITLPESFSYFFSIKIILGWWYINSPNLHIFFVLLVVTFLVGRNNCKCPHESSVLMNKVNCHFHLID